MYPTIFLSSTLVTLLWTARLATAETIVIEAGNLYFQPQNVNASVGDVLEFHFLPNNHSVVMGDLLDPCQPAPLGGFYSGFLPVSSGENAEVFQVTINNTDPLVYYCSQNASSHNHCKQGMIGFVNQPNASAIDAYQTGASTLDINVSPDSDAFGGILATNPNATAVGTGGSSATTASATGESGGDGASASSTAATATSGTASASASGTGNNDTSGAEARAVGAGGVLALMMALMAA